MSTDQGGLSAGSDYGYDLAHDLEEVRRRPPEGPGRSWPDDAGGLPAATGDFGYDEAHDLPPRRPS